jgi:hypothetical protein
VADRDKLSDADVDDWFAEPEPSAEQRAGTGEAFELDSEARTVERVPSPADDWLTGGEPSRARRPRSAPASSYMTRRALAVAGIGVVVLLAALAIAGVFSSSGGQHATRPSTSVRTTSPSLTTTAPATVQPPTTTLKPGDKGAQVRALQRALASLGYSTGAIDGSYGTATEAAVTKFQVDHHLTADGVVGPATLAVLASALRKSA